MLSGLSLRPRKGHWVSTWVIRGIMHILHSASQARHSVKRNIHKRSVVARGGVILATFGRSFGALNAEFRGALSQSPYLWRVFVQYHPVQLRRSRLLRFGLFLFPTTSKCLSLHSHAWLSVLLRMGIRVSHDFSTLFQKEPYEML